MHKHIQTDRQTDTHRERERERNILTMSPDLENPKKKKKGREFVIIPNVEVFPSPRKERETRKRDKKERIQRRHNDFALLYSRVLVEYGDPVVILHICTFSGTDFFFFFFL